MKCKAMSTVQFYKQNAKTNIYAFFIILTEHSFGCYVYVVLEK